MPGVRCRRIRARHARVPHAVAGRGVVPDQLQRAAPRRHILRRCVSALQVAQRLCALLRAALRKQHACQRVARVEGQGPRRSRDRRLRTCRAGRRRDCPDRAPASATARRWRPAAPGPSTCPNACTASRRAPPMRRREGSLPAGFSSAKTSWPPVRKAGEKTTPCHSAESASERPAPLPFFTPAQRMADNSRHPRGGRI